MSGHRTVLPAGGGKKDPRYAAEQLSQSSTYPPRTPQGRETSRRVQGWEPNPYGQFPSDPMSSSMVAHNSKGYDSTRSERFPEKSPMGRQYREYKEYAGKAADAAKTYNDRLHELNPSTDRTLNSSDRRSHRELAQLADNTIAYFQEEASAREAFNRDHIGRRTQDAYVGHKEASENAYRAADRYIKQAEEHERFSRSRRSGR